MLFQNSLFLFSQDFISESLLTEIEEFIQNEYKIFESNAIHKEVNNLIQENFFGLLQNYDFYDQNELDTKAMEIFQIIYNEIHFGLISDSSDFRRQSRRAAFCYSSLALCSHYDFNYYLDLANGSLYQNDDSNYDLLNEIYCIQILLDIYIFDLKSSLSGIRSSIQIFNNHYNNLSFHSHNMEEVSILVEKVSKDLPPNKK